MGGVTLGTLGNFKQKTRPISAAARFAMVVAVACFAGATASAQGILFFTTLAVNDFGYVPVGGLSEATFTLINLGDMAISGEASTRAPFKVASTPTYTLAPLETVDITVIFEPKIEGTFVAFVDFTGGAGLKGHVQGTTILPDIDLTSSNFPLFQFYSITADTLQDVTGDGLGDFVMVDAQEVFVDQITIPTGNVINGVDGTIISNVMSPQRTDEVGFGFGVSGIPDITGDGLTDVAVGARLDLIAILAKQTISQSRPGVHLYESTLGTYLRTLESPNAIDDTGNLNIESPTPFDGIGDVNGDGKGDIILGAPSEAPNTFGITEGRVYLLSGADGSTIHTLRAPQVDINRGVSQFGVSVSRVPDVDNDGVDDVAVRAHDPLGILPKGLIPDPIQGYVYSGLTGQLITRLVTPAGGTGLFFGPKLAGLEDVNKNGSGDVAVIVSLSSSTTGTALLAAEVFVFDGRTGTILHTYMPAGSDVNGYIAYDVSGVTDYNGDGLGDYVVGGSPNLLLLAQQSVFNGRVDVVDGATGTKIRTFSSPQMGNFNLAYGFGVVGLDDSDGDGLSDIGVAQTGNTNTDTLNTFYVYKSKQDLVDVVPSPRVGDFGVVPVGEMSLISFRLNNPSFQSRQGVVSTMAPFEILEGATYLLGPGQSQKIVVGVTPAAPGVFDGVVNFNSAGTITATLKGIAAPGLGAIVGQVLSTATTPPECATVVAIGPSGIEGIASIDLDGRYRIRRLAEGDYQVLVFSPGTDTPPQTTAVVAGAESVVDFLLVPRSGIANLRGVVISALNGLPIGGVAVEVGFIDADGMSVERVAFTCVDGSYEFALNVPAKAPVRVSTFSGDFFNQEQMNVEVTPNNVTESNFELEVNSNNPGVFSGIIRNASTGGFIQFARIIMRRLATVGAPPSKDGKIIDRVTTTIFSTESGNDGGFNFDGLVPGEFEVEVSAPGFPTQTGNVTVFEGDIPTILNFQFGQARTGCSALPQPYQSGGRTGDTAVLLMAAAMLLGVRRLRRS